MAGAGQAQDKKKQLAGGVHKTNDKTSRSVSNIKKYLVGIFKVWEKMPPKTWIHLISSRPSMLALTDTKRVVAVGRDRTSIVISELTICNEKKQILRCLQPFKKNKKTKSKHVLPFFPKAVVRRYIGYLRLAHEKKKKLQDFAFPLSYEV